MVIIILAKPNIIYKKNKLRKFGVSKDKTLLSIHVVAIGLALGISFIILPLKHNDTQQKYMPVQQVQPILQPMQSMQSIQPILQQIQPQLLQPMQQQVYYSTVQR